MIALPFLPKPLHRMGQYIPKPEGIAAPSITVKQTEVVDVSTYNYYFFWCYTLYPDGHIGQDSHNGMTFLMSIYDPSSGFKTAAGNTDFWVDADILKDIMG